MEDLDVELSQMIDRPGELQPLLTFGEAQAMLVVAHLLGLGDGLGASVARDLEHRLERRIEARFPGEDILSFQLRHAMG